jgi:hypothetical protein
MDYAAIGLVSTATFTDMQFLDFNLDDIAPKVGAGSTGGKIPEPATLPCSAWACWALAWYGGGGSEQPDCKQLVVQL